MDIEKEHQSFLTKIKEKFFNPDRPYLSFHPRPPENQGSTETQLPKQPTTKPVQETTTASPGRKWFHKLFHKWFYERPTNKPNYQWTTTRPLWTGTVDYERTTIRPYSGWSFRDRTTVRTITKVDHTLIIQSGSPFGLENCLWVALGGVGVLILMAIFMKLGQPIRRVRRQLSNNRPVITVSLNSDDRNFDVGSLLRLGDTAASTDPGPFYDPPPLYIECVGSSSSINKYDSEEPPPRYSASFENYKDAEPQVHIRRQNDDNVQNAHNEDGFRVRTYL